MNQRERTIAIATGVTVGLYALYSVVYAPLESSLKTANSRITAAEADLQEADNLNRRQIKERRDWKNIAGDSITTNRSIAEGQLINAVPGWARTADLSLTSIKPERSENEDGFGKITVRATASGDLEAVSRFLYAVQTADIPVRVADLTLASRREGEGDLTVQIGLSTIYRLSEEEARS